MPDAAGDDVPELVQGDGVGAGVVEQHHRPVLDIVQPPLRGNKSEQSCWIKICYIAVTRMDKFIKFFSSYSGLLDLVGFGLVFL